MSALPAGWAKAPLDAVISSSVGGVWGSADPFDGCVPVRVIRGAEFRNWQAARGQSAPQRFIPASAFASRQLQIGDVVLEVSGGGPTQPVGRTVLIDKQALSSVDAPLVCSNFCRRLVVAREMDPRFVWYQLQNGYARNDTDQYQRATTNIRNLQVPRYLAGTLLNIAPRPEQERIVATIEEQFSHLDVGVAALDRVSRNLKRFHMSSLRQMRDGPGERVPFGDLVDNHDGKRVPVKASLRRGGPYPYYGAQGIIDHVDGFLFDGDFVLIAEDGANLMSRVLPIAIEAHGKFWVNNHAHVVTPHADVLAEYLTAVLNADPLDGAITGTAQPKLPQKALNRLVILKPPVAEQRALVALLAEAHDIQQSAMAAVASAARRAKSLRSSILAAAFSGELVPQNPSDAPASTLLADIAAASESSNGHKRGNALKLLGAGGVPA